MPKLNFYTMEEKMFCKFCGKPIEDYTKFCPYCGKELSTTDRNDAKEVLKKTAGAVMDSAKVIGNSVNEATNGQAQKYAERAKETAKGFTEDVKQVAKDKDASNFFTKNKYRNVKILAVLLVAIFLLSGILGGASDDNEKNAILAVETRIHQSYPTLTFSDAEVIEKDGKGRYLVSLTVNENSNHTYVIGVAVFPPNSDDVLTSIYTYDDESMKEYAINIQKAQSDWGESLK